MVSFMKMSRQVVYLCIALTCILLVYFTYRAVRTIKLQTDEISWFYHIQFFEQLFIKRDVHAFIWQSYESYDHPQLSKYIFGAYVWHKDAHIFQTRDALEKTWGRWQFYFNPKTEYAIGHIFAPYLYWMREVNALFVLATLILLGLLMYVLTHNVFVSMSLSLVLSLNNFFMENMIRATPDAQHIFFMFASFLLYIWFRRRRKAYMLIASSVCAGLAVSAKLTGILIVYTLVSCEVVLYLYRENIWNVIRNVLCIIGISFLIWDVLNPALYKNPIQNSVRYFSFRNEQSVRLQKAFPSVALETEPSKIYASFCTVLATNCGTNFFDGALFTYGWINALFSIGGVFWLLRLRASEFIQEMNRIVLLFVAVMIIVTMVVLPLNSDRYYIEMQISVWLLEWLGIYGAYITAKNWMVSRLS